jgi:Mn2+/Fe2+ NRAMP family transporter
VAAEKGLARSFGPGLVWAATAIGVSHLVQSTRAGAAYGWTLVPVVLLANLLKYPFFEFGPRYAAATGRSLLDGYAELGRWVLATFLFLSLGSAVAVVGAVSYFTGSLATLALGPALSPFAWSALILAACTLLLLLGRYPLLDAVVKVIVAGLALSTLLAVGLAFAAAAPAGVPAPAPPLVELAGFGFLIALVGWMPSGMELSVFHSLWTLERARQTGHRPALGEALLDFNVGYFGTAFLALAFLALGALTLHGSGEPLATVGGAFAAQLIELYTRALGDWSRPVIAAAAFTTMLSTTVAVVDGFPRVLARSSGMLWPRLDAWLPGEAGQRVWTLLVIGGALLAISVFVGHLTRMIDFATTLSFVFAPVIGWFNHCVVTGAGMPAPARPPPWLARLSVTGLVFGVVFAGVFLVWRFALS